MRSADGGGTTPNPTSGTASAPSELLRWRETSMDPSALPARAADLVDAAREVPGLAPMALMRIYTDVTAARRPARARGVPLGLRLATLAVLILVSVATAKGAMVLWQRYVAPAKPSASNAEGPVRSKVALVPHPHRRVETAPVIDVINQQEETRPQQAPQARLPAPAAPARSRRAIAVEVPAPVPEAPPAADPVNEAQLLTDALRRLRQGHDPSGALALLDQYDRIYSRGVLAPEARSARLEATLKLGDRPAALVLLDQHGSFVGRLGAEQLLTRAELRASVGRYADALADFDRVLAPHSGLGAPQVDALERALYGRAVTLGHLGRDDRARSALEDYRRRFPAGKFAGEVARLLGKSRPTEGAATVGR